MRRVAAGGTCSFAPKRAALLSQCLPARRRDLVESGKGPAVFSFAVSFILLCHIHCPSGTLFSCNVSQPGQRHQSQVRGCCPLSCCCRSFVYFEFFVAPLGSQDECFTACVFFHCRVQANAQKALELGWPDRNGAEPHRGVRLCSTTGWFFFKLFRKTFFDAEIEAHVYFSLFVVESCLQVEATPGGLIDFWTCVLPFFHLLQVMILKIFFVWMLHGSTGRCPPFCQLKLSEESQIYWKCFSK